MARLGPCVAALLAGLCIGLLGGCGEDANQAAAQPAVQPSVRVQHFHFFSPTSFWNSPVGGDAIDPASAPITRALREEVDREQSRGVGPWINTSSYSVPIYRAPRDLPTVQVRLASQYAAPTLRQAWRAVPLPPGALPAAGNDEHLVVWQPATDRLWEFWHLRQAASGWQAGWGGAMQDVSTNRGVYDARAWPGAIPLWGASASSLSIAGGLITLEDIRRGWINHALAMSIPDVRAGEYALPARRTDGRSTNPLSLPEGAHLRLSPGLDLAALHLPRLTLMLAEAAQRFGIFIRDGAKTVTFYAQTPKPQAPDPYQGSSGFYEGSSPRQLLASFPWGSLELLAMKLHPFNRNQGRLP